MPFTPIERRDLSCTIRVRRAAAMDDAQPAAVQPPRRALWGWASYYVGNHAFTTAAITVFFPIFFKEVWSGGVPVEVSTLRLGIANSAASLLVALTAPLLGAIADRGGHGKGFMLAAALLGVALMLALAAVPAGAWAWAAVVYVLASAGNFWGNVFGDAMVLRVGTPGRVERTSAIGYLAGYAGGGVFLAISVALSLKPHWFGLPDASAAVRWIFALGALWWAAFTLPLLWWVPAQRAAAERLPLRAALREGLRQFATTVRHVRAYRPIALFLVAYWLYIDGVNTVIQMAVDYGKSIGLGSGPLILAVLMVQFIGVPAALVFGRLGERIGPKRGILIGLAVYVLASAFAAGMHHAWQFFALAAAVGMVQGGVQLLSRAYFARLVPRERAGEFFGFYNMLGEFAAILGPLLIGLTSYLSGDPRASILSVIVLFALGGGLLLRVPKV